MLQVPWCDDAKYIFVARNPKDCCVSFYHHMRQLPGYQFSDATFGEFFELYLSGELEFGDYFSHFLSWYQERHRSNVLLMTYEQMKKNLKDVVLKVAKFLRDGEDKYLQENTNILDGILKNCSFEGMKFINTVLNSMYDNVEEMLKDPFIPKGRKYIVAYNATLPIFKKQKIEFIRKGEVGSWKQVLTPEQNRRLEEKIKLIEHCSDVMSIWKDII